MPWGILTYCGCRLEDGTLFLHFPPRPRLAMRPELLPGSVGPCRFSPNAQKNGKARVEMRSRFYNVICARRYNGWRGPDTGTVDGEIDTDEDWNEDEEEIMDEKNSGKKRIRRDE